MIASNWLVPSTFRIIKILQIKLFPKYSGASPFMEWQDVQKVLLMNSPKWDNYPATISMTGKGIHDKTKYTRI